MEFQYYTKLSIIALGETGSGKSLFCKLFSKRNDFFSLMSGTSVTREIISRTFRNDIKRVEIELIDTPGYNDTVGDIQDKKNLEMIQNFLSEHNQRINCVIVVMNANIERLPNSIKKIIKSICTLFPLPDFWNHVIIFWTHWTFIDPEEEEAKKRYLNTDIFNQLKELSQQIFDELRINPIQNNLNMLYNEYSEITTNPERIRSNKEKSQVNFDRIIDLAKNMTPIYENILPPVNLIELQEPRSGTIFPNYIQYKYKKMIIRKYKDFHNEEIIERPEILFTFYVHENETEWEKCEQESNEIDTKYKKYKKRIFIDEENNEFNPGNDIDIPKIEIKREKNVRRKFKEKPVEGNPKRKKILEYDEVNYSDINELQIENEKIKKEIEEGETEWIKDTSFNEPNIIRNVKYKTITEYDNNGNKIDSRSTNEEIDWEKIETKIENDIPQRVDENITNYIEKKTILKTTKNNPNPIEMPGGSWRIVRTEQFKDEFDEPVKNLDAHNIGEIKYNCYRVKYINNVKQTTPKTLIPSKSYSLYYRKDNEPKTKTETRDGKNYEIIYNEIYMVNSREPNKRNSTNFTFVISENEINIITRKETRETIVGDMVKTECYKLYYKLGKNREEDFIKEELVDKDERKIELGKEYFIIESPMSLDKINQMRTQKNYPIIYKRIYYKNETNTKRELPVKTGKVENVELKLDKLETKKISEDNKFITFKTEFHEVMFINNEKKENNDPNIIDTINKTYDLIIKSDEEETYQNKYFTKQKYKCYYYYPNGKEILDHKEKDDKPKIEKIEYGKEYYEKEYYNKNEIKNNPKIGFDNYYLKQKNNYYHYYNEYDGIDKNFKYINNNKKYLMKNYNYYNNISNEEIFPYSYQIQIQSLDYYKEKEKEKYVPISNNKYPIIYKKIYYHDEINTKRKLKVKTGKVENIEIKLEHVINNIESEDKQHTKIEEYDIEVMYINGKLDNNKDENNKINYKETNIYKYEEKEEKGKVSKWFRPDEHHFDIYEITKIIKPNGEVEINRALKQSDFVERYN